MLATIANKRKIEEATSKKDDVAPVYLLEEIWELVHTSNQEIVSGIVDYIVKRLGQSSPIIKQKALRLIKFLCAKGASEFKRGISRNAGPVRELTHYKGTPDAFKGDLLNQKVRDTAKEAVEAMFAPTETPTYSQAPSSMQGRIQGFGSSQDDHHSSSTSGSGARGSSSGAWGSGGSAKKGGGGSGMLGFGNPNYDAQPSSSGNVPRSSSSRGFGRRGGYEAPGEAPKASGGAGMMQRMGSGALSPRAIMSSISAKGSELMQGRRGPGILSNDDNTGYSSDEADRGYDRPGGGAQSSGQGHKRSENGGPGGTQAGGEGRLVEQICTPGGLRAQPTREDLRLFVESAGSLNGDTLAQLLEAKMGDPSWQAVLRALSALEAVIQNGSTAACGQIAVYFQTDPASLERAMDFPQASVRQRAARVLQLLGVGGAAGLSKAPAAAGTPPPADLLGGLDEPEVPQPGASANDILGDLMSGDPGPPASAPASASTNGIFSGLDLPSSSPHPPPAPAPEVDFFGAMAAPSQPTPAAPPRPHTAAADPFWSSNGPGGQKAGAGGDDLFGGLSVGGATSASGQPDLMGAAAPANRSSSASGFADFASMHPPGPNGGRNSPSATQLAAQRTASMEKQADPLAGVGLPQAQNAPMGQGLSAQRGSSPAGFQGGQQGAYNTINMQQLTPQQLIYMHQVQYAQYLQAQQMQAMQAGRGMPQGQMPQMGFGGMRQPSQPMMGGFAPTPAASFHQPQQQPSLMQANSGLGGGGLDMLGRSSSPGLTSSSSLGITQQSDFGFVNDHVKGLRGKK